jgi:hypothetical protein
MKNKLMMTRTTTAPTRIFIHVSMPLVFCSIRRRSSFGSLVGAIGAEFDQGKEPLINGYRDIPE